MSLVLFVALIVTLVLGGLLHGLLVSHLRRFHLQVWRDLGEPHVLAVASKRPAAISEFVWRGGYHALADERVTRLALAMRILTILFVVLFLLGVLSVVLARSGNAP
jgi:hypothetical protein